MQSWRDAPSVVGRGDYRCDICQQVIEDQNDAETFEGSRVHGECLKAEQNDDGMGAGW